MPEQIFDDCCEFCQFVDDAKAEVDPCTEMTRRCKGDTCATCPSCPRFIRGLGFTSALKLSNVRKRPKNAPKAGKLRQGAV